MTGKRNQSYSAELIASVQLDADQLCHCCRITTHHLIEWVEEGIVPARGGTTPERWRFDDDALRRARLAARLSRELHINTPGVAMVIELLEERERLYARLARATDSDA